MLSHFFVFLIIARPYLHFSRCLIAVPLFLKYFSFRFSTPSLPGYLISLQPIITILAHMKHHIPPATIAIILMMAATTGLKSCELIDYHPYDVRISGSTDINAKNISRIENKCKDKKQIKVAAIGDTHNFLACRVCFKNRFHDCGPAQDGETAKIRREDDAHARTLATPHPFLL